MAVRSVRSGEFWSGCLSCTIAWYLATGDRKLLVDGYNDYLRRGASDDVRAHLEAVWKGKK